MVAGADDPASITRSTTSLGCRAGIADGWPLRVADALLAFTTKATRGARPPAGMLSPELVFDGFQQGRPAYLDTAAVVSRRTSERA